MTKMCSRFDPEFPPASSGGEFPLRRKTGSVQELGDGYCFIIDPIDGYDQLYLLIINSAAFPSVLHGKDGRSSALCTIHIQKNCIRRSKERAHTRTESGSTAVKRAWGNLGYFGLRQI